MTGTFASRDCWSDRIFELADKAASVRHAVQVLASPSVMRQIQLRVPPADPSDTTDLRLCGIPVVVRSELPAGTFLLQHSDGTLEFYGPEVDTSPGDSIGNAP